jgi:two-component system response regulator CpxR
VRVLLADDDEELCEMLSAYLAREGFSVDCAHDGEAALELALRGGYELIVLDVMMPKRDGFEVLRRLRRESFTPVLMLTARGGDVDSIIGLELGADDYLPKPCNPRVLVARMRAVLRRAGDDAAVGASGDLTLGDIELQQGARRVRQHGEVVELTSTEYSVLAVLMQAAGKVVSKEVLSEQALGRKLTRYDRSLDMHISNLRRKLGPLPGGEERIQTVRGVGYLYSRMGG